MSANLRRFLLVRTTSAAPAVNGHAPKRAYHVLAEAPEAPVKSACCNCSQRSHRPGTTVDGVKSRSASTAVGTRRWISSSAKLCGDSVAALQRLSRANPSPTRVDAVVIGAGQAGLSVAYHLQKAGDLRYVTLDANQVRFHNSSIFHAFNMGHFGLLGHESR